MLDIVLRSKELKISRIVPLMLFICLTLPLTLTLTNSNYVPIDRNYANSRSIVVLTHLTLTSSDRVKLIAILSFYLHY